MRQSHLILSNAIIIWATRVLLLVPQFILVPYLIRTIGESSYGVYVLVWSLMMSIEQLHKSLQSGVVKYSAGFLAQGLMDKVNKVVSSSFVYSLLLAVLACVGILAAAMLYKDPSDQIGTALVVVGIMILFIFPLTPYTAIIQSKQLYYVGSITDTVSTYFSLFAVMVWFSIVGPSIEGLIIVMTGMLFLSKLAQVPFAYRLVPGLRNHIRLFDGKSFRMIATFGAGTVLASLSLALNSTGVRWLMSALASSSFVAHLAIMLMPAVLLSQIIDAMTITIMPATSAYEATGNQEALQELMIRGMRYSVIILLAGLLAATLLLRDILRIWVGSEYVFLTPYAMALFTSRTFMLSTSTAHHMLKGTGKLRAVVLIYWIGLVIVPIGLILLLFQIWHNPYIAVSVGLSLGYLVCGCLQIGFGGNNVKADMRKLLMRVYGQPLALAVLIFPAAFGVVTYGVIDSLWGRLLISILAILLFLGGLYIFIASETEQQQVRDLVRLAVSKIKSFRDLSSKH